MALQVKDMDGGIVATAEAEQQHLTRKLQKVQRQNRELLVELDTAKRKLQRLRQERNLLLDRVYERQVATLEFSSESSEEEEEETETKRRGEEEAEAEAEGLILLKSRGPALSSSSNATGTGRKRRTEEKIEEEKDRDKERERSRETKASSLNHRQEEEGDREVLEIGQGLLSLPQTSQAPSSSATSSSRRKAKRIVKTAEMAAATPRRVHAVATDEQGHPILPVTMGVVTVHSLGSVIYDRPGFHNKRYIWPVGFHSSRPYMSAINANQQTVYHSCILDGGTAPLYDVFAEDQPAQHYQSPTSTGAWTAIVKQAHATRGREYTNSASGPDFFGLSNSTISMLIERLPNADKCPNYQRKNFETIPPTPSLLTSRSSSSLHPPPSDRTRNVEGGEEDQSKELFGTDNVDEVMDQPEHYATEDLEAAEELDDIAFDDEDDEQDAKGSPSISLTLSHPHDSPPLSSSKSLLTTGNPTNK